MRRGSIVAVVLAWAAAGCTSPEATRQRAGGPGADVGNTGERVEMHGGALPYYATPNVLPRTREGRDVAASPGTR